MDLWWSFDRGTIFWPFINNEMEAEKYLLVWSKSHVLEVIEWDSNQICVFTE